MRRRMGHSRRSRKLRNGCSVTQPSATHSGAAVVVSQIEYSILSSLTFQAISSGFLVLVFK